MNRRKQILFYGIMVVMTLAVIEGMAQAAYYIAYGEFNGGGDWAAVAAATPDAAAAVGAANAAVADEQPYGVLHPYYGYTRPESEHLMNRAPPPRREDGVVLIALLGGSVGLGVTDAFRSALESWFRDNDLPLRPVVLGLAYNGMKQPQQVMQIANILSLGGEFDLIVNLDGYNELFISHNNYFEYGISPFFPLWWQQLVTFTAEDKLRVGQIAVARERQERLRAAAQAAPWRWSALYGIISRYRLERVERQLVALNYELATPGAGGYSLERQGPRWDFEDQYDLRLTTLRVWYRGSVMLRDLSRTAGAEYYHFLQPNQYVPDSKPLSAEERAIAYDPESGSIVTYNHAYPQLLRLGDELRRHGVNYHDLTQIFADNGETLYSDDCCHLNARGYELLADAMVQRLAPALQRRAAAAGQGGMAAARTALDSSVRAAAPDYAVNKLYFDVRLTADGVLRYTRDNCIPADAEPLFFLHLTPVDAADLWPEYAVNGFNNADFFFSEQGGVIDAAGRCVVERELPDYAIESIRTGQALRGGLYRLWEARLLNPPFIPSPGAPGPEGAPRP